MTQGRIVTDGVEKDRLLIRATAQRIIRTVVECPVPRLEPEARRDWLTPPRPQVFRNLEPLGWGLEQDDVWYFHPSQPDVTPAVIWPMRAGIVVERGEADGYFSMTQATTAPRDKVRGLVNLYSPWMMRIDHAQGWKHRFAAGSVVVSWLGGKWVRADSFTGRPHDEELYNFNLMIPVALRQRYQWAVSIGTEGAPSVRFDTDPTGIKEIFRLRDLPEGKDRREALMLWVLDHWRQTRNDPDIEFYVRSHLRGNVSFNWRGMECEIQPSAFDLEKNFQLKDEREAMRRTGTDRRRKRR